MKADVLAAIAAGTAKAAAAPPPPRRARPGGAAADDPREERVRMSRLRQAIARRLKGRRTPPPC